jgi:hypothetical protein
MFQAHARTHTHTKHTHARAETHLIQRSGHRYDEQCVWLCAKANNRPCALIVRQPELSKRPLAAEVLGQRDGGYKALLLQSEGAGGGRAGGGV